MLCGAVVKCPGLTQKPLRMTAAVIPPPVDQSLWTDRSLVQGHPSRQSSQTIVLPTCVFPGISSFLEADLWGSRGERRGRVCMSPWEIRGCPRALGAGGGSGISMKEKSTEGRRGFPGPVPPTLLLPRACPGSLLRAVVGDETGAVDICSGSPGLPHCSQTRPSPPASCPGPRPHGGAPRQTSPEGLRGFRKWDPLTLVHGPLRCNSEAAASMRKKGLLPKMPQPPRVNLDPRLERLRGLGFVLGHVTAQASSRSFCL